MNSKQGILEINRSNLATLQGILLNNNLGDINCLELGLYISAQGQRVTWHRRSQDASFLKVMQSAMVTSAMVCGTGSGLLELAPLFSRSFA